MPTCWFLTKPNLESGWDVKSIGTPMPSISQLDLHSYELMRCRDAKGLFSWAKWKRFSCNSNQPSSDTWWAPIVNIRLRVSPFSGRRQRLFFDTDPPLTTNCLDFPLLSGLCFHFVPQWQQEESPPHSDETAAKCSCNTSNNLNSLKCNQFQNSSYKIRQLIPADGCWHNCI